MIEKHKRLLKELASLVIDINLKGRYICFYNDIAHCSVIEIRLVRSSDDYNSTMYNSRLNYCPIGYDSKYYNIGDINESIEIAIRDLSIAYEKGWAPIYTPITELCVSLLGKTVYIDKEIPVEVLAITVEGIRVLDGDRGESTIPASRLYIKD